MDLHARQSETSRFFEPLPGAQCLQRRGEAMAGALLSPAGSLNWMLALDCAADTGVGWAAKNGPAKSPQSVWMKMTDLLIVFTPAGDIGRAPASGIELCASGNFYGEKDLMPLICLQIASWWVPGLPNLAFSQIFLYLFFAAALVFRAWAHLTRSTATPPAI